MFTKVDDYKVHALQKKIIKMAPVKCKIGKIVILYFINSKTEK